MTDTVAVLLREKQLLRVEEAACGVLLSRAYPNLWLLILGRARDCTITAVGEGRVVAEIREQRLLIRFR